MNIGIDDNLNLVYESMSRWGHALWPAPLLIPAQTASSAESQLKPLRFESLYAAPLIFREDAFDPVSRVRRGRFYRAGMSQPVPWQVYPHPAAPEKFDKTDATGTFSKPLFTFSSHSLTTELPRASNQQLLVMLGSEESFTIWSVIAVEKTVTREELVTLKARQGIGVLPRINNDAIPEASREKVLTALDKLVED